MATNQEQHPLIPTPFRPPGRHRIMLRRRKTTIVRLGGKKPRKGYLLVRLVRSMRLRWKKLQISCVLKRLKEYYRKLIKELIDAGATIEAYQQRLLMEATLTVPVGVSFSSFPSRAASNGLAPSLIM